MDKARSSSQETAVPDAFLPLKAMGRHFPFLGFLILGISMVFQLLINQQNFFHLQVKANTRAKAKESRSPRVGVGCPVPSFHPPLCHMPPVRHFLGSQERNLKTTECQKLQTFLLVYC